MKTALIIPSIYEYNLIDRQNFKPFNHVRVSGMGKVNSLICASELIYINRVNRILLFGLAGGLKKLKVGNIIEPTIFIEGDYIDPVTNQMNILAMSPDKLLNYSLPCSVVSQDRFLYSNPYKFHDEPLATDMESYAVAKLCNETMTEFNCVRVISDVVGDDVKSFDKIAKSFKLALDLCLAEIGDSICTSK